MNVRFTVPQPFWETDSGHGGKVVTRRGALDVAGVPVASKHAASICSLRYSYGIAKEKDAPYNVVAVCEKEIGPFARTGEGENIPRRSTRREKILTWGNVRILKISARVRDEGDSQMFKAPADRWYVFCEQSR